MAVKVKVGSLISIYTGKEQHIKVVLSFFLRIIFTEKRIEIKKKTSYKNELQKEKKLIMIDHLIILMTKVRWR